MFSNILFECRKSSDLTFNRSEIVKAKKSFGGFFHNLEDVDDLFRDLALKITST